MFTVFENDGYNIYAGERHDAGATGVGTEQPAANAAVLPPAERRAGPGDRASRQFHCAGCPKGARPTQPKTTRPSCTLDAISQPTVGVGVDQFGAYGGGGISFLFSDVLGEHVLGANVMIDQSSR